MMSSIVEKENIENSSTHSAALDKSKAEQTQMYQRNV